jgi:hypothetical protein
MPNNLGEDGGEMSECLVSGILIGLALAFGLVILGTWLAERERKDGSSVPPCATWWTK